LTYYHREGPLGQLFAALDGTDRIKRVGAVGLGAGSAVCYRKPGQTWVFYEIDPVVERLARDTRYFHFMSECAGDTPVVLGDARLSLRSAPEGYYDLMILDAFSSDAIPIHLLTREAVELYLSKLADNGILMFNISSRFLDLTTVLGNVAADLGLAGRVQIFRPLKPEDQQGFKSKSDWVVLARTPEALAMLDGRPGWKPLEPRPAAGLWTDDFSNIIGVLKWWQTAKDKAGGS
jgi:spermidine synthase